MKNYNFILLILLFSVTISASTLFAIKDGYALTNPANQTVAITTQIFPITILTNELMPLLDTSAIGNLTALTVTANLPCDTSNVPTLKIIAGILGNTTNVIDSSADYTNNKGPRDTCVFTDKITNVTAKGIPAMNRVFLKNTGSTPVHIPEGVMVTLTGIFGKPAVVKLTVQPDFQDDYTTNSGWTQVGTAITVDSAGHPDVAYSLNAFNNADHRVYKSIGTTLSSTFIVNFDYFAPSDNTNAGYPLALTAGTGTPSTASQDAIIVRNSGQNTLTVYYKDGAADGLPAGITISGLSSNVQYYVRLTESSSTSVTLAVYTDSARTIHAGNSPQSGTISGVTGLTTLQHANQYNAGAGADSIDYKVDNTKIWNGVTSPP